MSPSASKVLGPVFIFLGFLLLAFGVPDVNIGDLWPLAPLGVGVFLLLKRDEEDEEHGGMFAGCLLVLLGIYFFLTQWDVLDYGETWPFFILAPGLAFLAVAVWGGERGALIPAGILIAVSLFFWLPILEVVGWFGRIVVRVILPLGLILLGAWLTFGRRERIGPRDEDPFPDKISPHAQEPQTPAETPPAPADEGETPAAPTS